MQDDQLRYGAALTDFRRARLAASVASVLARVTGRPDDLLPFEEVRRMLRPTGIRNHGLQQVPLSAIVGSVGRYRDFNRNFLPRRDSAGARWARVQNAMTAAQGVPPIELYQIGDAYFVLDGNHRVSVARQLGMESIQAYVTEIITRVPMSAQSRPDELILKAERAAFLEESALDTSVPDHQIHFTAPGRYQRILYEIHRHATKLALQGDAPSIKEAARSWYMHEYLPIAEIIQERGLLRDFPGRTEADLYIWLVQHREALERSTGWRVSDEAAVSDLAAQKGEAPGRVAARLGERVRDALTPAPLEEGPSTGEWRRDRVARRRDRRLFADVLVAVDGSAASWHAVEQALRIVQKESGRLLGLHVLPSERYFDNLIPQLIQREFEQRVAAAGVEGRMILEVGEVAPLVCDRARWSDLVVTSLAHPPGDQPLERLRSGFRSILRRCPRPVLALAGPPTPLDRLLLAYDGSPKADEALFVSSYASQRWGATLHVVQVGEGAEGTTPLSFARRYLEGQEVAATYEQRSGAVAESLLAAAVEQQSNLIVMGGYGLGSLREIVLGSTVDHILRARWGPTLICR